MLSTYGFNVPLCLSSPIHSTNLALCLSEIEFQSLEAEHLPPEEANLDAKILLQLLLHLSLCLLSSPVPCHWFVFLTLAFDHL